MSDTILQCTQCNHTLREHGNDWKCTNNCRCTMAGCIPRLAKYGTLLEVEAPE